MAKAQKDVWPYTNHTQKEGEREIWIGGPLPCIWLDQCMHAQPWPSRWRCVCFSWALQCPLLPPSSSLSSGNRSAFFTFSYQCMAACVCVSRGLCALTSDLILADILEMCNQGPLPVLLCPLLSLPLLPVSTDTVADILRFNNRRNLCIGHQTLFFLKKKHDMKCCLYIDTEKLSPSWKLTFVAW